WANLLDVVAAARDRLGATRSVIEADAWQPAIDGDVERLTAEGAVQEATDLLTRKLEHSLFEAAPLSAGLVSLVGAGPGDPGLLTLRAADRLCTAEVVVHDRLVSERVLDLAASTAERIDVGKRPGGVGARQHDLNALLVEL